MHDRVDAMIAERAGKGFAVADVTLDQRSPVDGVGMAGGQVVIDDGQVTGFGQGLAGVRADIAGAAGDKDAVLLSTVRHSDASIEWKQLPANRVGHAGYMELRYKRLLPVVRTAAES
jgi:hypothetical protein